MVSNNSNNNKKQNITHEVTIIIMIQSTFELLISDIY